MPKFKLGDFLDCKVDEKDYDIYAVFNGRTCLYVGLATSGIWIRWLSGTRGHLCKTNLGRLVGNSNIGNAVVDGLPESLNWTIEMRCSKDMLKLANRYVNSNYTRIDAGIAELAMIRKYKPVLNVLNNS